MTEYMDISCSVFLFRKILENSVYQMQDIERKWFVTNKIGLYNIKVCEVFSKISLIKYKILENSVYQMHDREWKWFVTNEENVGFPNPSPTKRIMSDSLV